MFKNHPGPLNKFLPRPLPRPSSSSDSSSSDPKTAQENGSTVVILGAGKTAHDIAASTISDLSVARVILWHRNGFFVALKVTPEPVILRPRGRPYPGKRRNKPLDTTIPSLLIRPMCLLLYRGEACSALGELWLVGQVHILAIWGTGRGLGSGLGMWRREFFWAFSGKGGRC